MSPPPVAQAGHAGLVQIPQLSLLPARPTARSSSLCFCLPLYLYGAMPTDRFCPLITQLPTALASPWVAPQPHPQNLPQSPQSRREHEVDGTLVLSPEGALSSTQGMKSMFLD